MRSVNHRLSCQKLYILIMSDRAPTSDLPSPTDEPTETQADKPPDSYVKLAMRNMVRKRGTSLKHFFLTTFGLLAFFIGMAYLTR
jgi:hypothetical protein